MTKRAIRLNSADNVAVCTEAVEVGDVVSISDGTEVKAIGNISFCNKIALKDIRAEDRIFKYGEIIGKATCDIACGALVNHENIVGIARAYRDEYIKE